MEYRKNFYFKPVSIYQKWYKEYLAPYMEHFITGLILVSVFGFAAFVYIYKLYIILEFGVSFYDPSSAFAEQLVHLYNIVWIILLFVVFFILVLLIRIIYLFNWRFVYFSSDMYLSFTTVVLEYFLVLCLERKFYTIADVIIDRLYLIDAGSSGLNSFGLNLWYNKDTYAFLRISEISEYRQLEVVWCLLPICSLLFIASPTFSLIFSLDAAVDPAYTIKIVGRQWYWTYSLNQAWENQTESYLVDNYMKKKVFVIEDKKLADLLNDYRYHNIPVETYKKYELYKSIFSIPLNFEFDSSLVSEEDLAEGSHRLLEVDNRLCLPVGVPVRLLITSSDVLHSWAIPSLGIKVDAVPGRLNQFIVDVKRPGVFYGQCSELCGAYHGFMPIVITATTMDQFEDWVVAKTYVG